MFMQDQTIAFIGAGNMASALILGLQAKAYPCEKIWATDPDTHKLDKLSSELGINTTKDNTLAVQAADIVVLAIKPQMMEAVLSPLQNSLIDKPVLLVSIAAGISISTLESLSSAQQAIVRCMPNTPALLQAGASALFANEITSNEQKQNAEALFQAVGSVSWLQDEKDMDAVTALSGSGPAYFFLFIEALRDAAVAEGLDSEVANKLALQTAFGAARLALESDDDVAELRAKVTSPGGTTAAALDQFENDGFSTIIARAVAKAKARSEELALLIDNKK